MTTQRPIPENDIPTNFNLTNAQKQQAFPYGVMPSSQATNIFLAQPFTPIISGSINSKLASSGINNPLSSTSNLENDEFLYKISNISISGYYTHYYGAVKIPYISTFKVNEEKNPYPIPLYHKSE